MKRIVITTLLALALAPVALAGPGRDHNRGPRSLNDLAYELHDATRHVADQARFAAFHWRGHETPASRSLARLNREAARFEKIVDRRHRRDSWRLERDFVRLFEAYERASYQVSHVRSPHIRRDFERVRRLMDRMSIRVDRIADHRPPYREDRSARPVRHGSIEYENYDGSRRVRVRIGR